MILKVNCILRNNSGLTLLEVLIAAGLFTLFTSAYTLIQSRSVDASIFSEHLNNATMLAEARMVEIEQDLLSKAMNDFPKEAEGKFDTPFEMYSWKSTVREIELPIQALNMLMTSESATEGEPDPLEAMAVRLIADHIKESVREVTLEVKWVSVTGDEELVLSTYIVDYDKELNFGIPGV